MSKNLTALSGRMRFLQLCIWGIWGVLALRLLHVQWISQATFATQALRQQVSHEPIPARPGDLLDRKGRLLATTISVPSLYLNPSRIDHPADVARGLSKALGLDQEALAHQIATNSHRQFLWVQRHISPQQQTDVEALKFPAGMFGFRDEFKRFYPQESLAAHVIGLRDIDGIGQGGAEQAFEDYLRGVDGVRRFVRDARGTVLEVLEEVTQPPQNGNSVVLTLDMVLQLHTEKILDELVQVHHPVGASVIVLDPRNGEVLAMASRPTFHPSPPGDVSPQVWKNLAISAVYEPGSTIKPIIVAWGLDRGLLQPEEQINCAWGKYRMGPRTLHDHHSYGELSLTDVLVKSSNIGMAKIGERLGNERLYSLMTAFGFGQKTGIELAGEVSGILHPLRDWNGYSTGSIPMGHELAVTPLQMIAAHAILANGGRKVSPHLLLKTSHASPLPQQVLVSQVVSPDVAKWVVQGPLKEVIERGTGKQAQLKDYAVFGKTGTAQKVNPQGGYFSNKNVSSFVCGAPAENPRLLVLVSLDEPQGAAQFGGTVAAPFAARILDRCLKTLGE